MGKLISLYPSYFSFEEPDSNAGLISGSLVFYLKNLFLWPWFSSLSFKKSTNDYLFLASAEALFLTLLLRSRYFLRLCKPWSDYIMLILSVSSSSLNLKFSWSSLPWTSSQLGWYLKLEIYTSLFKVLILLNYGVLWLF